MVTMAVIPWSIWSESRLRVCVCWLVSSVVICRAGELAVCVVAMDVAMGAAMARDTSAGVSDATRLVRCAWSMSWSRGSRAGLRTAWWLATNSPWCTTPASLW